MKASISTVILAGGQSRRFDYDDKGLLEWQGMPLINHVISKLAPQSDEILINCHQHTARYAELGYPTFKDSLEGFQGPLAGIAAAIPLVQYDYVLISPCDTPLLPDNLVERLQEAMAQQSADIAYPECEGRQHYLPVLLKKTLLPSINQYLLGEDRSMKGWYRLNQSIAVPFSNPARVFSNFNCREDLLD
ncbi:molybdenum cofactor guanylyltransferase MobA [Oceanicoccus sagamiensis]|uniref:Molybdenum cofactor guanylyltransferase n=1 Tax=Oceanicoccus sagamiensis TaxID=716816 RepID=A0A1X9NE83_9GAMM|nr:molybdenum cofactor guanylyltransferase MobA [Oceanicoccus sagamiensis]ARN75364.1 molybdenum cofactor guanylyltransferase [Oceanicoccus sagamiensis]